MAMKLKYMKFDT